MSEKEFECNLGGRQQSPRFMKAEAHTRGDSGVELGGGSRERHSGCLSRGSPFPPGTGPGDLVLSGLVASSQRAGSSASRSFFFPRGFQDCNGIGGTMGAMGVCDADEIIMIL